MIITRTPFRVSFAGGGSDLREFYEVEPGAVTSTAIDKYMYIVVKSSFRNTIRVSYSRTEMVTDVEEVQHPIVREAMKLSGITAGVEIVSIGDIPSATGLGSSSSFTVGLLNALYAYRGLLRSAEELAREACRIEIDILGEPIGKQDQYIAAYGGLRHICFQPDGGVSVQYILSPPEVREELNRNLLLLYMGSTQAAAAILQQQKANTREKLAVLRRIRDLAVETRRCLSSANSTGELGELLHEEWELKKQLAQGISNPEIDEWYERARRCGAIGGKVLGAGGRGFLLLYCPQRYQQRVLDSLNSLQRVPFALEAEGSKIIYVAGEHGE